VDIIPFSQLIYCFIDEKLNFNTVNQQLDAVADQPKRMVKCIGKIHLGWLFEQQVNCDHQGSYD